MYSIIVEISVGVNFLTIALVYFMLNIILRLFMVGVWIFFGVVFYKVPTYETSPYSLWKDERFTENPNIVKMQIVRPDRLCFDALHIFFLYIKTKTYWRTDLEI